MKQFVVGLILAVFTLMAASCSQAETGKSESGQGAKPKVVGPAFVMFYTEN